MENICRDSWFSDWVYTASKINANLTVVLQIFQKPGDVRRLGPHLAPHLAAWDAIN